MTDIYTLMVTKTSQSTSMGSKRIQNINMRHYFIRQKLPFALQCRREKYSVRNFSNMRGRTLTVNSERHVAMINNIFTPASQKFVGF